MNRTLRALERRLSPGQLTDQVLGYFRGAREESGEFATNLGRSIKDNPVPVTLLGIGLSWLMITGSEKPERRSSQAYRGPIITPSTVETENSHKREQTGQAASEKIHERAEQMAHGAREKLDKANHIAETAQEAGPAARLGPPGGEREQGATSSDRGIYKKAIQQKVLELRGYLFYTLTITD